MIKLQGKKKKKDLLQDYGEWTGNRDTTQWSKKNMIGIWTKAGKAGKEWIQSYDTDKNGISKKSPFIKWAGALSISPPSPTTTKGALF